jgi:hypothetical protein
MSWTIDEWFVITPARTVRPREAVFHGSGSPCAGDLRTVPPPSTAELATLRSVDALEARTSEFSRREPGRAFGRGDGRDGAC